MKYKDMKKLFCLLVAVFAFAITCKANAVELSGVRSCEQWLQQRKASAMASYVTENWILGFLSGIATESHRDFLKDIDNEQIYLWIDNYCLNNPLKNLGDAGTAFGLELIKQKAGAEAVHESETSKQETPDISQME